MKGFNEILLPHERTKLFSNALLNFRKIYKNKIIVTAVGPQKAYLGYYDLTVFDETVDYIALGPDEEIKYVHMPNFYILKKIYAGDNGTMVS